MPPRRTAKTSTESAKTQKADVIEAEVIPVEVVEQAKTNVLNLEVRKASNLSVRGTADIGALTELQSERFRFDYSQLSHDQADTLQGTVLTIQTQYRILHESVITIGRALIAAKESVPDKTFMSWFETELAHLFTYDTADNYMVVARLSEKRSLSELERMSLNTLYVVGRRSVPEEAEDYLFDLAATEEDNSKRPNKAKAKKVIRDYKTLNLSGFDFEPDVKRTLIQLELAEEKDQLRQLDRLSKKKQEIVVAQLKLASLSGRKLTVRQALLELDEASSEQNAGETQSTGKVIAPVTNVVTHRGDWVNLIQEIPSESIDFCFAEVPLSREGLTHYQPLAQNIYRILRPGGFLLSVVGQQNIQFVGPELDPLKVAWTFMMLRRPGHSPRIVGRITYASSYIPLSLAYKDTLRQIPGTFINDARAAHEFDQDAYDRDEKFELNGLESCMDYYTQLLTNPSESILHLVTDHRFAFDQEVAEAFYQSCRSVGVADITAIIGR